MAYHTLWFGRRIAWEALLVAYHMLGFGRRIAWEALLAAYQAMIREAHRLGGTTSELSNPLAKLSRK